MKLQYREIEKRVWAVQVNIAEWKKNGTPEHVHDFNMVKVEYDGDIAVENYTVNTTFGECFNVADRDFLVYYPEDGELEVLVTSEFYKKYQRIPKLSDYLYWQKSEEFRAMEEELVSAFRDRSDISIVDTLEDLIPWAQKLKELLENEDD